MPTVRRIPAVAWRSADLPYLGRIALLALGYFATANASLLLAIPPGYATAVWPPSGIALAALVIWGGRVWPGVWLGAALANFQINGLAQLAAAIATGNTLEGLCAAWLIGRLVGSPLQFRRPEAVFWFAAAAAVASVVAATIGVSALYFTGVASREQFFSNWYTWWQGDTTGIIVLTPCLLAWLRPAATSEPRTGRYELVLYWGLLAATLYSVLGRHPEAQVVRELEFLLIPFLAWAGCRFDARQVSLVVLVCAGMAVWGMVHGDALRSPELMSDALLILQAFTSTLALMGLALYAVVRQRADAIQGLEAARSALEQEVKRLQSSMERQSRRMIDAQQTERRVLALELHEGLGQCLSALRETLGSSPTQELRALLDRAVVALRALAQMLRPAALGGSGLLLALRAYAARFSRRSGLRVEITGSEQASMMLEPLVESGLLWIAQEALDDIERHGGADSVRIHLSVSERGTILMVRDDRIAFAPRGRGVGRIRKQAEALHGTLRIESIPSGGASVIVKLPPSAHFSGRAC